MEDKRINSARSLAATVGRFVNGPRADSDSRVDPLYEIVESLSTAWASEGNRYVRSALGEALEATHKGLHRLLKPDETAEGRAVSIARRFDPAADQNAQSIVIHPLHRPGAPGLDAPPTNGTPTAGAGRPVTETTPRTEEGSDR